MDRKEGGWGRVDGNREGEMRIHAHASTVDLLFLPLHFSLNY